MDGPRRAATRADTSTLSSEGHVDPATTVGRRGVANGRRCGASFSTARTRCAAESIPGSPETWVLLAAAPRPINRPASSGPTAATSSRQERVGRSTERAGHHSREAPGGRVAATSAVEAPAARAAASSTGQTSVLVNASRSGRTAATDRPASCGISHGRGPAKSAGMRAASSSAEGEKCVNRICKSLRRSRAASITAIACNPSPTEGAWIQRRGRLKLRCARAQSTRRSPAYRRARTVRASLESPLARVGAANHAARLREW